MSFHTCKCLCEMIFLKLKVKGSLVEGYMQFNFGSVYLPFVDDTPVMFHGRA